LFCVLEVTIIFLEEKNIMSKMMNTQHFFNEIPLTKTCIILIHKGISIILIKNGDFLPEMSAKKKKKPPFLRINFKNEE
jgi:hypothetical protein